MADNAKKPGLFSRIAGAIVGGLTGLVTGVVVGAFKGLGFMGGNLLGAAEGMMGIALVGLLALPAIAIGAIFGAGYAAYEGIRNGGTSGFVEGVKAGAGAAITWERQGVEKSQAKQAEVTTPAPAQQNPVYQQENKNSSDAAMSSFFKTNPAAATTQKQSKAAVKAQTATDEVTSVKLRWGDKIADPIKAAQKELRTVIKDVKAGDLSSAIDEKLENARRYIAEARKHPRNEQTDKFINTLESRIDRVEGKVAEKKSSVRPGM